MLRRTGRITIFTNKEYVLIYFYINDYIIIGGKVVE